jgi:hypothetical protein
LTERGGIPLAVLISAANRNDDLLLDDLVDVVRRCGNRSDAPQTSREAARRQGL